jgi:hypothetical protein
MAEDIPRPGRTKSRSSIYRRHCQQSRRVDGQFIHQYGLGARASLYRTQSIRTEPMVRAYRMGASFAQRLSTVDHRIRQGSTQCQQSPGMFRGRRGKVCAWSREGIIPSMRGYHVIDPPFVPDESGRGRRATCIALHQSTRERCTEQ